MIPSLTQHDDVFNPGLQEQGVQDLPARVLGDALPAPARRPVRRRRDGRPRRHRRALLRRPRQQAQQRQQQQQQEAAPIPEFLIQVGNPQILL